MFEITKHAVISCSYCMRTEEYDYSLKSNTRIIKADLRRDGWSIGKYNKCPRCKAEGRK